MFHSEHKLHFCFPQLCRLKRFLSSCACSCFSEIFNHYYFLNICFRSILFVLPDQFSSLTTENRSRTSRRSTNRSKDRVRIYNNNNNNNNSCLSNNKSNNNNHLSNNNNNYYLSNNSHKIMRLHTPHKTLNILHTKMLTTNFHSE